MDINMPQLGESVTEGTIGKWLVKPGDRVARYQPIAEVITDKVNAEIPAPQDGEIIGLDVAEGVTVAVGTRIATLSAVGAEEEVLVQGGARGAAAAGPRYSPVVMRLAQEHDIDLSRLTGTGLGGRVTRKDVESLIAAGGSPAPAAAAPPATPAATTPAAATPAAATPAPGVAPPQLPLTDDQVIPVDAIRRRIAERMVQSRREAPHAWTMMEVDVTGLVRLRDSLSDEFAQREGISLSYMPFFIRAVVESLREYPMINSQWAGDKIIVRKEINISVAVATDTALAVPVIKQADRLSVTGLNHAVADLAARARAGKLTLDDISGGTFTVNNTGYFGSNMSAPIINYPQAAILSFEVITKRPVVLDNDAIAIRSMMNMCMSLDHRVLDGMVSGRFLQAVRRRLESYGPGTISLF